jgi:hypothetical protein
LKQGINFMGQSAQPQWWEIITRILTIPTLIIGLYYSYVSIQKTLLEVQKTKLEIIEKEKKLFGKSSLSNKDSGKPKENLFFDNILIFLLSPFLSKNNEGVSKSFQKIFGVIIEFVYLCAFLFAATSLFAGYYSVLYPNIKIPSIFQGFFLPLLISSVGLTGYLAILLSDILGNTNILGREFGKRNLYLSAVLATLFFQVIFSVMIAASRFPITLPYSDIITQIGLNLIVVPLLMSMLFAFRGILAIAVLLAVIVYTIKIITNGLGTIFGDKKIRTPK